MALTRITKGVIKPNENYDTHNINSTGIITATGFAGPVTGAITGNADTATLATNVTVSANNSTNETVYPVFVDGATGTQGVETDTGLTYNPSSNTLTAGTLNASTFGPISGTTASFSGNVSIGGTLTYEDVTNIDSIGIITAKSGIHLEDYIFHKGDTNTSIGFPSADTVFVKTSGVERLRIDSSGRLQQGSDPSNLGAAKVNIVTGGDDGISLGRVQGATVSNGDVLGTIAFQTAVGAQTTNSAEASIKAIAAENSSGSTAATDMAFFTKPTGTGPGSSPTRRITILSTGKVGINTTSISQRLTVFAASGYPILASGNSNGIGIGGNGAIVFGTKDLGSYAKGILDATELEIKVSGTPKINLETTGKIAIGNHTGATHDIHIKHANSPGIKIEDTTQSAKLLFFAQDAWTGIGNFSNHALVFYTNSTPRLRILHTGNVGIGTDNPGFKLDVDYTNNAEDGIRILNRASGSSSTSMLRLGNDENINAAFLMLNSSGYGSVGGAYNLVLGHGLSRDIVFATGGAEKLRIKSDGDVIIGSGGSWQFPKALNVQGPTGSIISLYNADTTSYAADTNSSIELKLLTGNTGNQTGAVEIRGLKEEGTNGNNARAISFWTGTNGGSNTERLRITSSGQLLVGTTSSSDQFHLLKSHNSHTKAVIQNNYGSNATAQLNLISPTDEFNLIKYASGDAHISLSNSANIIYNIGGSERLRINSSGAVSIASNNYGSGHSTAKLRVGTEAGSTQGTAVFGTGDTAVPALTLTNWDGSQASNWSVLQFDNSGWGNFQIGGTAGADAFSIYDDTVEKLRITSTGDVHMGNSGAPSFASISGNNEGGLEIHNVGNDTAACLKLTGNNNSGGSPGQETYTQLEHRGGNLTFNINHAGSERFRIHSTGRIIIDDSSGNTDFSDGYAACEIRGSGTTKQLVLSNSSTGDTRNAGLWFKVNHSGQDERVKGAIIYASATSGYGRGNMLFCTESTDNNDNVDTSDERMRVGYTGIIDVPNYSFRPSRGTSNPGGAVLYFSGSKGTTNSAFDMFKIYTVHGNTTLKIQMAFHHSGGGVHGSYTSRYYTMNSYDSLNGRGTFQDSNFGGGGGFTFSRAASPNNGYVTVRYNGSSSFHQNFNLMGRIEHGQSGSANDLYLVKDSLDGLSYTINY